MKFAIAIPQFYADGEFDPGAFRAYFARAEELGFDSAWTQEGMLGSGPQLGPIETMTYAAACTQRMRLGCVVFVSTLHSPVHLAKSISTLDQLSRGRIEDAGRARRRINAALEGIYGRRVPAIEAAAFAGTAADCVRELQQVAAAGAELILGTALFDQREQMERLAADVIPQVG